MVSEECDFSRAVERRPLGSGEAGLFGLNQKWKSPDPPKADASGEDYSRSSYELVAGIGTARDVLPFAAPPGASEEIWQVLVRHPLPLQRESALFLIASVLDVMMTYLLLACMPGADGRAMFYESNPLARYFFEGWGVRGIVCFKFVNVAIVEVIAHIVAMKRLEVGRRLLDFGTLTVSAVVLYSMVLLLVEQ